MQSYAAQHARGGRSLGEASWASDSKALAAHGPSTSARDQHRNGRRDSSVASSVEPDSFTRRTAPHGHHRSQRRRSGTPPRRRLHSQRGPTSARARAARRSCFSASTRAPRPKTTAVCASSVGDVDGSAHGVAASTATLPEFTVAGLRVVEDHSGAASWAHLQEPSLGPSLTRAGVAHATAVGEPREPMVGVHREPVGDVVDAGSPSPSDAVPSA